MFYPRYYLGAFASSGFLLLSPQQPALRLACLALHKAGDRVPTFRVIDHHKVTVGEPSTPVVQQFRAGS